jgi:V/A-type H+-transporting ATPase subunit A
VETLGQDTRPGSITAIGAVSPPGGDLSEPVSQATLRIVKVFWGLSAALAYRRHYPSVDWLTSYSLYTDKMADWYAENIGAEFPTLRKETMKLLQISANLEEIVRLVGEDSLSAPDRLILETAKSVREDYLMQDAFHEVDTFASMKKQYKMLKAIMTYHAGALAAINRGVPFADTVLPELKQDIARAKYLPETEIVQIDDLITRTKQTLASLAAV